VKLFYFSTFFLGVFFSLFLLPAVMDWAERRRIYDRPDNKRKIHGQLVPLCGGLGIYISFYLSLGFLIFLFPSFRNMIVRTGFSGTLSGIFLASTLILFTGISDDKKALPPTVKLLLQVIAALLLVLYGLKIEGFKIPFSSSFIIFPQFLVILVTLFWLVGFSNLINLVDGLDGLAGGITVIASLTFFFVNLIQMRRIPDTSPELFFSSFFALLVAGATLGFLYYNFFPANIFLGDSGSLFLGFMLGIVTVMGMLKLTAALAFFIPIVVVAFPLADVLMAILRRMRKGKPIMQADAGHFHHYLLRKGWNQREIVFLLYNVTLVLSFAALVWVALSR